MSKTARRGLDCSLRGPKKGQCAIFSDSNGFNASARRQDAEMILCWLDFVV